MQRAPGKTVQSTRTRGRPPVLSRRAVLDGALELLDTVGLNGFTMRSLGTRLGVDAMAIYHYFPSRTALLDGVVERVLAETVSPQRTGDWRADAAACVHAFRRALLAHPEAVPLIAMRPPVTPDAFETTEALLDALAPANFSPAEALNIAHLLGGMTVGHVIAQAGPPPGADHDGREAAHAASASTLPSTRFPRIALAYASGYTIDHDTLFARAVDITLDAAHEAQKDNPESTLTTRAAT